MSKKTKLLIRKGQELPPNGEQWNEVGVIKGSDLDDCDGHDVVVFSPGTRWSNTREWNYRDETHVDVAHFVKHLTLLASQHGTNTYDFIDEMCRLFEVKKDSQNPDFWEDRPSMVIDIANECLHQTRDTTIRTGSTEIITDRLRKCVFLTSEIPDKDKKYIEEVYDFDDFVKGMGYETGDTFTYYRYTPARGKTPATYDLRRPEHYVTVTDRPSVINLQTWKAFFDRLKMFKDSEWEEDMDWVMELLYSGKIQKDIMAKINKEAESILNDAKTHKEKNELTKRLKKAKCSMLTGRRLDDIKALLIRDTLLTRGSIPVTCEARSGANTVTLKTGQTVPVEIRKNVGMIYTKTGRTRTGVWWRVAYSPSQQSVNVQTPSDVVDIQTEKDVWTTVKTDSEEYLKLTPTERQNKNRVRGATNKRTGRPVPLGKNIRIHQKGTVANLSPKWNGDLDEIINPIKDRVWSMSKEDLASAWNFRRELNGSFSEFKGRVYSPYNVKAKIPELVYMQTTEYKNKEPFKRNKNGKLTNYDEKRDQFRVGHTIVAKYDNHTGTYEMVMRINHYQSHKEDWDGIPTPSIKNKYGGPREEALVLVEKLLAPKKKKKVTTRRKQVVTKKADRTTFSGEGSAEDFLAEFSRRHAKEDAESNKPSLEEE